MARKQALCLLGAAVAIAVVSFGWVFRSPAPAVVSRLPSSSAVPLSTPAVPAVGNVAATPEQTSSEEIALPSLPANATHVPDEYLLKLSTMVHLINADEHRVDKARWSQALPVAERLVQGPCDCEQRNWLNHFIFMGNAALTGMDEDYYRTAVLMQRMARNDQQLADHPEFFAR